MKRFYYLAAALLVLAGAAGCKKNADVQDPELQPSGKMRTVTIQAGQGATKTSVSGGALTWSAGDKLNIVPTSGTIGAVALDISSGVGGATGTFTGDIDDAIKDDTQLYGWCGGSWTYNSGSFSIDMPATQTYKYNGLAENAYPSIGSGSIQNGITLNNPFGVLKLTLKGNLLVKSITVTSTSNNLAGSFTVTPDGSVSGGSSKTVILSEIPNVEVGYEDKSFYVVVPVGSYAADDINVTVEMPNDIYAIRSLGAVVVSAGNVTTADVLCVKGKASTKDGTYVNWVQLWQGGPKWAEYNVGSDENQDYNAFYTWGGKYKNGNGITWQDDHNTGDDDLSGNDDTATYLWGDNWRMFTLPEHSFLVDYCTSTWVTNYNGTGKNGRLYTGEYDTSLFLPAAGSCKDGKTYPGGSGAYWSMHAYGSSKALVFTFSSSEQPTVMYYVDRNYGRSVRAVLND